MALLEVRDLTKTFRKHGELIAAVKNVSFAIEQGECLGLVGESGCGKSTTANIISRLIKEDSGTIQFDGNKISGGIRLKPVGKSLQMIFQAPQDSFDPRDTVLKGVMQGAASYKLWSREALKNRALELFDYVGLKRSYAKAKTAELSGGECQRAAIARALICEPKLLICDEATSALDVLVQAQIVDLLRRLKTDRNMSLLFITHDIPLAAALCDRTAVMHQGEIVEIGDSKTVLKDPKHEQTKKLIGSVLSLYENETVG
ncbi:MAG: ABC transporter ATP-binding protein [Oscillospiraceae bacterium]|jgi:ABC-type dipeptide/oligopeptide/nickel transport system ATPase subunit